jgi:FeS assembly SUF system regulator
MLRISKLADYATVVMVYLARQNDVLCNAKDIASQTHISIPTVSKLLKILTTEKLLLSVRGSSGGYRLAKTPDLISVAEILYAFEEKRGLTTCSENPDACALHQVCHIKSNWTIISHAIDAALKSVTLAALATEQLSTSQPIVVNVQPILNLRHGVSHV